VNLSEYKQTGQILVYACKPSKSIFFFIRIVKLLRNYLLLYYWL